MRALFGTQTCHRIWLIVLNVYKRGLLNISIQLSYDEVLNLSKTPTLKERRDTLCKQYFIKMCTEWHKLNHLLPPARDICYSIRKHDKYAGAERTNKSIL